MKAAALLIGINYVSNPRCRLNGCWNDAIQLNSYLGSIGMPYSNIRVLIDNSPEGVEKTSKDSIIQEISNLSKKSWAEELDVVVFSFSGHGSQTRDLDGDEMDGLDEGICPSDMDSRGLIIDDELYLLFRRFNPKTRVYCIFDCCHSGTMLDLPNEYPIVKRNVESSCFEQNIVMISGCTDPQCSADAWNQKTRLFGGALTMALLQALQSGEAGLLDLHRKTLEILRAGKYTQFPVISSTHVIDNNTRFLQ